MNPIVLDRQGTFQRICRNLGISLADQSIDRPPDPIIAEYLRSSLCALALSPQAEAPSEPVYVTRLTNCVRRQLAPVWPELALRRNSQPFRKAEMEREGDTQPDPVRRVLEGLNDLRDVCELREGYWLPCPVRLVELPEGGVLVVGGAGIRHLREMFGAAVRMTWIARELDRSNVPSEILHSDNHRQTYECWLGEARCDLGDWTNGILATASELLRPSGSDFSTIEVYAPWLQGQRPQYFRWVRADELRKLPTQVVLCRSSSVRWGPRSFFLGRLGTRSGQVCLKEEYSLESSTVRLLQYGLDLLAHTPTRVQVEKHGSEMTIGVKSWLPPEERRLFLALAQDISPVPGRFPLKYRVSCRLFENLRKSLESLGIHIESVK